MPTDVLPKKTDDKLTQFGFSFVNSSFISKERCERMAQALQQTCELCPNQNYMIRGFKLPKISLIPSQVIEKLEKMLREDNIISAPILLSGGAARYILTGDVYHDFDFVFILEKGQFLFIQDLFIDLILEELKKQKSPINFNHARIRDFIVAAYLYKRKLIKGDNPYDIPAASFFSIANIDFKFVFKKEYRFHVATRERFFFAYPDFNLYYLKGKTEQNKIQDFTDLTHHLFRVEQPEKITGLAFRRIHAEINGCQHMDTSQAALQEFTQSYPLSQSTRLIERLFGEFYSRYSHDMHGRISSYLGWLRFLIEIENPKERDEYVVLASRAMLGDFSPNLRVDELAVIEKVYLGKIERDHAEKRKVFTFAKLLVEKPALAQKLMALLQGVFLGEWFANNPEVQFDFSRKIGQLLWRQGDSDYYIPIGDLDQTIKEAVIAQGDLIAYSDEIDKGIKELNFSTISDLPRVLIEGLEKPITQVLRKYLGIAEKPTLLFQAIRKIYDHDGSLQALSYLRSYIQRMSAPLSNLLALLCYWTNRTDKKRFSSHLKRIARYFKAIEANEELWKNEELKTAFKIVLNKMLRECQPVRMSAYAVFSIVASSYRIGLFSKSEFADHIERFLAAISGRTPIYDLIRILEEGQFFKITTMQRLIQLAQPQAISLSKLLVKKNQEAREAAIYRYIYLCLKIYKFRSVFKQHKEMLLRLVRHSLSQQTRCLENGQKILLGLIYLKIMDPSLLEEALLAWNQHQSDLPNALRIGLLLTQEMASEPKKNEVLQNLTRIERLCTPSKAASHIKLIRSLIGALSTHYPKQAARLKALLPAKTVSQPEERVVIDKVHSTSIVAQVAESEVKEAVEQVVRAEDLIRMLEANLGEKDQKAVFSQRSFTQICNLINYMITFEKYPLVELLWKNLPSKHKNNLHVCESIFYLHLNNRSTQKLREMRERVISISRDRDKINQINRLFFHYLIGEKTLDTLLEALKFFCDHKIKDQTMAETLLTNLLSFYQRNKKEVEQGTQQLSASLAAVQLLDTSKMTKNPSELLAVLKGRIVKKESEFTKNFVKDLGLCLSGASRGFATGITRRAITAYRADLLLLKSPIIIKISFVSIILSTLGGIFSHGFKNDEAMFLLLSSMIGIVGFWIKTILGTNTVPDYILDQIGIILMSLTSIKNSTNIYKELIMLGFALFTYGIFERYVIF